MSPPNIATPFQAMFGRMACIPVDINSSPNYDAVEKLQEFLQADQPSFSAEAAKWQKDADIIKENIKLLKLSKREIMIKSITWQNVLGWDLQFY